MLPLRNPQLLRASAMRRAWMQMRSMASRGKQHESTAERNQRHGIYVVSALIGVFGMSYAAVPLYKAFCAATGFGGTTQRADGEMVKKLKPVANHRRIRISFAADVPENMPWSFTPQQREVKVVPGETALAFYTAKNHSQKPVIGVATYNVNPTKVGVYFNKIQCFCFEEQRLKGDEEVDMPIFFFLDPKFADDPQMQDVHDIVLSYTFFKTEEEQRSDQRQLLQEQREKKEQGQVQSERAD